MSTRKRKLAKPRQATKRGDGLIEFEYRHQTASGWQHSGVRSHYYRAKSEVDVKRHVLSRQRSFAVLLTLESVRSSVDKKVPAKDLPDPFCEMSADDLKNVLSRLPADTDREDFDFDTLTLDLTGINDQTIDKLWDQHNMDFDGSTTDLHSVHQYIPPKFETIP